MSMERRYDSWRLRTLSRGINHFHEAHPVVHHKLLAISVLYCGIVCLSRVVMNVYHSSLMILAVRRHTSVKIEDNWLFNFCPIENDSMPLTNETIQGELVTKRLCQHELKDWGTRPDLHS